MLQGSSVSVDEPTIWLTRRKVRQAPERVSPCNITMDHDATIICSMND